MLELKVDMARMAQVQKEEIVVPIGIKERNSIGDVRVKHGVAKLSRAVSEYGGDSDSCMAYHVAVSLVIHVHADIY